MKNRIEGAEKPWIDQLGQIITIDHCINACSNAGSLFLKELEFNPKIKDNEHIRTDYERSRIIMNKMRENYERAKAVLEGAGKKPRLLMPRTRKP
jgi:hypothetical protein